MTAALIKKAAINIAGREYPTYQNAQGERVMRDLDIASVLGLVDPHSIRRLIAKYRAELGPVSDWRSETSPSGGRPGVSYYLTEEQALFVTAKCRTPIAMAQLKQLIAVFIAARLGDGGRAVKIAQGSVPPARALPGKCEPLLFALRHPGQPIGWLGSRPVPPSDLEPGQMQLTDDPGAFWSPGAAIWVALPAVVLRRDEKTLVAAGVQVIREASKRDLATAGVYFSGTHHVSGDAFPQSYVERQMVYAFGEARVITKGLNTTVRARGRAVVIADSGTVIAHDDAQVIALGVARVYALDRAMVDARDNVTVQASGQATVRGRGRVVVRVESAAQETFLSEQAVRLEYDRKPTALPRASMAQRLQLGAA